MTLLSHIMSFCRGRQTAVRKEKTVHKIVHSKKRFFKQLDIFYCKDLHLGCLIYKYSLLGL